MPNVNVTILKLSLHNVTVGYLTGYQDGKSVFVFDESYRNNVNRPTLTVTTQNSFPKSATLLSETWNRQHRLHPIFSNLLPEGAMRQWFAQQLKIHPDNEFPMFAQLGKDLPGALIANVMKPDDVPAYVLQQQTKITPIEFSIVEKQQQFSLAGEQMKFSMKKQDGRYQINQQGELGSWIIKTPSTRHKFVPLNEYTAMTLAGAVGVEIPDIRLVPMENLDNLPPINLPDETLAYAIRRFDRSSNNERIHTEDFAQVFFKYPHDKYQATNYEQIAKILYQYSGNQLDNVQQLARRLLVNILLANGDAHLKNWSLIYRNGITPELSPAYDILTTRLYIKNETDIALNLGDSKSWYDINLNHFETWARKADIPWRAIKPQLLDVLEKAKTYWPSIFEESYLTQQHKNTLVKHWKMLHEDFKLI
jgi:serine/threonine-protein kinase HipA